MSRFLALLAVTATLALAACGNDNASGGSAADTAAGDASTGATTSGDGSATGAATDGAVSGDTSAAASVAPAQKININAASEDQMRTIPGVGDKMVHEFEEYRPYRSIQQFRKEIGKYVDEATVAGYEKYIYVPIDFNGSDMETLAQIPGITMSEANQLVTARPFASQEKFYEMLATFVSPEELAVARTYVETK